MPGSPARIFGLLLAALCCAPAVSLLVMALASGQLNVSDSISRFLPDYLINSLMITAGAGAVSLLIGCYSAWYVARYEFPLRRVLQWLLILPLAMPAYLLAMVYGHVFDVAGSVQQALRALTGWQVGDYWFAPIHSPGGAVLVLSLSLYPYVYLIARQAFTSQCRRYYEAAWLQGVPPQRWLWRVAIPSARPALALGCALVMMESLADFGVVSLFGVPSFTTGIYRAWYGLGQPDQAARLAVLLLGIVAAILYAERVCRGRMQPLKNPQNSASPLPRLAGGMRHSVLCALPVIAGFVLPLWQLLAWAMRSQTQWLDALHWQAAGYSVLLGVMVAGVTLALALVFAYLLRRDHVARWQGALVRLATLGYGIPGSVIAVALFMPLFALDRAMADLSQLWTGQRLALLLTGSMAAMVLACAIRFLAVAMASVEAGLQSISRRIDETARLSGTRPIRMHWPHLKLPLLIGGFMVFADTIKELPASLLLRPFNVSTLSIRSYELASDAQLVAASVPALMMVGIGTIAVLVMMKVMRREER